MEYLFMNDDFSQIYKSLWPQVYNFIYYKVQNTQEAEELTQEVFQRVYKQIKVKKIDDAKVRAYTFTAARNIVYDKWRKKGSRPKLITLEGLEDKGFEVEAKKEKTDEKILVEEAMKKLSAEDREVITLRILEGYSIQDVADKLGKPPGTIKVLQHRALQKLKKILEMGGYFW